MKLPVATTARLTLWRQRSRALLGFLQLLWEQSTRDNLMIRASGLAYTSLLAVVPLAAVGFALFTAFDRFAELKERVQAMLLDRFLPSGQEEIIRHMESFIENSRNLGFLGFALLLFTAVLLLDNISWNFNQIWRVSGRRSVVNRLMAYTSVLVFGTFLIGLSVTISMQIRSFLADGSVLQLGLYRWLGSWLFPLASSFLAFFLMFLIIPATTVRLGSAALGAMVSALFWELGKHLFALSIGQSVRYSTLYGSLAAVPIFLIWLYVTWILILVGLELSFTHQHRVRLMRRRKRARANPRQLLVQALGLMLQVGERFQRGEAPPRPAEMVEQLELDAAVVDELVEGLVEAELIRSCGDAAEERQLIPAVPLEKLSLRQLLRAAWREDAEPAQEGLAAEVAGESLAAAYDAVADLSLRDLLERADESAD